MTGYINQRNLARVLENEALKSKVLMKHLTKAICILLAAAFIMSAALLLSKQLEICYTVRESVITVNAGDTLWNIADEYIGEYPGGIRGYIAEICRRNGIENIDQIAAGTRLTVPVYHYRFG